MQGIQIIVPENKAEDKFLKGLKGDIINTGYEIEEVSRDVSPCSYASMYGGMSRYEGSTIIIARGAGKKKLEDALHTKHKYKSLEISEID